MQINKKYFILLLFLLLGVNSVNAHPFYVSICQIDYNEETKSLEIAVKIFADDLLLGLENAGKTKIYLGEKKEDVKADEYIFDYLSSQYRFMVNNEKANLTFVGKELDNDVVWTYLEIENIVSLNTIDVKCTLLTEVLESQSNIIQVNKNGIIKNMLLSKNKTSDSLVFE
jgi:hypothetical protein